MNYSIDNETIISMDSNAVKVRAELWAASAADIPDRDGIEGRVLAPGSIAVVPTEGKFYVLGFTGLWAEWGTVPVTPETGSDSEVE